MWYFLEYFKILFPYVTVLSFDVKIRVAVPWIHCLSLRQSKACPGGLCKAGDGNKWLSLFLGVPSCISMETRHMVLILVIISALRTFRLKGIFFSGLFLLFVIIVRAQAESWNKWSLLPWKSSRSSALGKLGYSPKTKSISNRWQNLNAALEDALQTWGVAWVIPRAVLAPLYKDLKLYQHPSLALQARPCSAISNKR